MKYLKAFTYILLAYTITFILEAQHGGRLELYLGSFWTRRLVFPVGFWVLTLFYGLWTLPKVRALWKMHASNLLASGVLLHTSLLMMEFVKEHTASTLNSPFFIGYAYTAAVTITAFIMAHGLNRAQVDSENPSLLPFIFLPLVVLVSMGTTFGVLTLIAMAIFFFVLRWEKASRLLARLSNSDLVFLAFLFGVAFIMRGTAAHRLASMGMPTVLSNCDDAHGYNHYARQLLNGMYIDVGMNNAYSLIVAIFYKLFDFKIFPTLFLQSFYCSTVPIGVYLIARELFDRNTARAAGIMTALSLLLIFNSVNLTREAAGSFFMVWTFFVLLKLLSAHSNQWIWSLFLGAIAGYLASLEQVFLAIFPLTFCLIFWLKKWPATTRVRVVFSGACTFLLVVVGLKWLLTGVPGLVGREPTNAANLFQNSIYGKTLFQKGICVLCTKDIIANFLWEPYEVTKLFLSKIIFDARRYFLEATSGAFDPLVLVRNSVLAGNMYFYGYLMGIVGAVTGLIALFRKPTWPKVFFYLILGLHLTIYSVFFFGFARFRAIVQPLLMIFIAYGMTLWFERFSQKSEA